MPRSRARHDRRLEVADLPAHVPLLSDVLAVCEGMVVNIEIKNAPQDPGWDPGEAVAALTAAAIDEAGWTARVLVSSFQTATLRAVQAADGRLALGASGASPTMSGRRLRAVESGIRRRPPVRGVGDPELVERAHAMGLAVNVWTVNTPEDLRAMMAAGVDTVITDRLSDALAAVAVGRLSEPGVDALWGGGPKSGLSPGRMAGNGSVPQRWSAMNVVVCVKQIPDPAAPRR